MKPMDNNIGFEMEESEPKKGNFRSKILHAALDGAKATLKDDITKSIAENVVSQWKSYCTERRAEKNKKDAFRKGPAPIEDADSMKKAINKATYGTLDSDVEDLEFEDDRTQNGEVGHPHPNIRRGERAKTNQKGNSLASCRALIVYFSKLAKTKDEDEVIDLNFVASLLQSGADINFSDRHGQCVMHEIVRAWHPDVAKFAIQSGADVNKPDKFGRTPLHLASAVDYSAMVEFLVKSGASLSAVTKLENQTPMHYAAKNNATGSLKALLRLGAFINDRDYKLRTPLFVASETARSEAARFLIEQGAPVGVYDDSGTPCLSLMIEKMPHIAMDAVEQFHNIDRAFRKHYFYLSFLENDPKFLAAEAPKGKRARREHKEREKDKKKMMKDKGMKKTRKEKTFAKPPLEVIVQYNQLDLIMHPVFQRLLAVKWNLFGKWGVLLLVAVNLFFTLIWTFLGIFIPRDRNYYDPPGANWWRMTLELIGVLMTGYFIFNEIQQLRVTEKSYNKWRQWRTRQVERDLQFCHPRWPEEKKYLESELQQIRTFQRTYFREPWNIFEWITYFVILTLVITRIMSVASNNKTANEIHPRVYSLGLVIIWLRFMRSCRAFRSLGPFIAILGSVIADTLKFAFLFFEFFIPYTVGFWILFGGNKHGATMGEDNSKDWAKFNDLVFSVWQMTLVGDFNWDGLVAVDRLMAQILVGSYFALTSVVCLNLYIALLSDTFSRVYAQAKANAVMQQAQLVMTVEKALSKKKKVHFGNYMQKECGPLEVYSRDEGNMPDDHENDMFDRVVRQITNRIGEMEDNMQQYFSKQSGNGGPRGGGGGGGGGAGGGTGRFGGGGGGGNSNGGVDSKGMITMLDRQNRQMIEMKQELDEVKQLMFKLLKTPASLVPPVYESEEPFTRPGLYPSLSQSTTSTAYETPQHISPGSNFFDNPERGRINGYQTEPDNAQKARRRRRGRGKKSQGTVSDYDSDAASTYSEQIPMLNYKQQPRSLGLTGGVQHHHQQQGGGQKGRNRKGGKGRNKTLGGSWEDIRSETEA